MLNKAHAAIDPSVVEVVDLSTNVKTMDAYIIRKQYPDSVMLARMFAMGSGYGDIEKKAIQKAITASARIGGKVLLITSSQYESASDPLADMVMVITLLPELQDYETTESFGAGQKKSINTPELGH